ncbi:cytochrome c family protein [Alcanivorax hongdengensis A-11-3]|uniref:Cytochrome c family protein n=1 Tax=Alcanivorax hongdengensis A-11-3 TaxID=1177179 RepID=L0WH98_9GAMM|nr:cytochrome c [Alcanivorax hongdengensis]EKF75497.1 cytochrome c family protein [Alcanivorax hongdengensis A-11-3]
MKTVIVTLSIATLAALLVATGLMVSGSYNVAADEPHWSLTEKLLGYARERSIERRAEDVQVPEDLDDPKRLAEGIEHYNAMCTGCHLAPGMQDSEMRPGLYPKPPELAEHGIHDPRQTFWIIKHGIKMSGMPAWGETHSDEKIWDMVALLKKLPEMDAAQWQKLTANLGGDEGDDDDHDHDHHHL